MDFLTLCQRVRQEGGIAGTGPTAVTTQIGIYQKIVEWVSRAWLDIQSIRPDWNFLHNEHQFSLTIGNGVYTPAAMGITNGVSLWVSDSVKMYDPAIGVADQHYLNYTEYAAWRRIYELGSVANNAPVEFSENPLGSLVFGPAPDKAYTVDLSYFSHPVELVNNTDVPAIATHLHPIIIYRALMYYAGHDDAPDVYQDAKINFDRWLIRLENDQLPSMSVGSQAIGE